MDSGASTGLYPMSMDDLSASGASLKELSAEEFARLENVNGFLAKPFTPEAVRDVITKALEAA